jgi:hypothetical protein
VCSSLCSHSSKMLSLRGDAVSYQNTLMDVRRGVTWKRSQECESCLTVGCRCDVILTWYLISPAPYSMNSPETAFLMLADQ